MCWVTLLNLLLGENGSLWIWSQNSEFWPIKVTFHSNVQKGHTGRLSFCFIFPQILPAHCWVRKLPLQEQGIQCSPKWRPIAHTWHQATLITTYWLISPLMHLLICTCTLRAGVDPPTQAIYTVRAKATSWYSKALPIWASADMQSFRFGVLWATYYRNIYSFYLLRGASARIEHTRKRWLSVTNTWQSFFLSFCNKGH